MNSWMEYTHIYIYTHVYIYICIYTHIYIYTRIHSGERWEYRVLERYLQWPRKIHIVCWYWRFVIVSMGPSYQSIVLITKNVWGISQPRLMTPEGIFNDGTFFQITRRSSPKKWMFLRWISSKSPPGGAKRRQVPLLDPPCKTLEFWALVNSWRSINFPQDHFQKSWLAS